MSAKADPFPSELGGWAPAAQWPGISGRPTARQGWGTLGVTSPEPAAQPRRGDGVVTVTGADGVATVTALQQRLVSVTQRLETGWKVREGLPLPGAGACAGDGSFLEVQRDVSKPSGHSLVPTQPRR